MPDRVTTFTCGLFHGRKGLVSKPHFYNYEWVNKLYRGVARNMSSPYRFVCLTDQPDENFDAGIEPYELIDTTGDWLSLNECFRSDIGIDRGVFMGLDTIICRPLDDIVDYDGPWAWMRNPVDSRLHDINAFVVWDQKKVGDRLWETYSSWPEGWRKNKAIHYAASTWPGTTTPVMTLGAQQDAPSEMLLWAEILKMMEITPDYLEDLHPDALISANLMAAGTQSAYNAHVLYFSGSFTPASDTVPEWLQKHWI